MIDEGSLNFLHTTFSHILVEMDVSKDLPAEISLKSSRGNWVQPVDFEGVPFRCRRCFKTGHLATSCGRCRIECITSLWKEEVPHFYRVEKVVVDHFSPQALNGEQNGGNEVESKTRVFSSPVKTRVIK
ncbi:hypothetical protein SUGI_0346720 [Cryptomeria japonica]|nr:hypothetical protein SUGI_0346720 [Cryptomeria japonica]